MKKLTLLRHAKSSWANAARTDVERPLNDRGRKAAALIGAFMAVSDVTPDLILCSPAARTRETLALVLPYLRGRPPTIFEDRLYHASPGVIREQISTASADQEHILVIGHNPGIHMLALELADRKSSDGNALNSLNAKYPTAALAHFNIDVRHWNEIGLRSGKLVSFTTPKELLQRKST